MALEFDWHLEEVVNWPHCVTTGRHFKENVDIFVVLRGVFTLGHFPVGPQNTSGGFDEVHTVLEHRTHMQYC